MQAIIIEITNFTFFIWYEYLLSIVSDCPAEIPSIPKEWYYEVESFLFTFNGFLITHHQYNAYTVYVHIYIDKSHTWLNVEKRHGCEVYLWWSVTYNIWCCYTAVWGISYTRNRKKVIFNYKFNVTIEEQQYAWLGGCIKGWAVSDRPIFNIDPSRDLSPLTKNGEGDPLKQIGFVLSENRIDENWFLNNRRLMVLAYATGLRSIWVKSFGEKHVLTQKSIVLALEKVMKDYEKLSKFYFVWFTATKNVWLFHIWIVHIWS